MSEHAAELTAHFTRGNAPERAVPHLLAAAAQALARDAHVEACGHLDAAVEALDALPPGPERQRLKLEVSAARGPALIATMGWAAPEVQRTYEQALDLARRLGQPPDALSGVLYGLATVHEDRGEYRQSRRLMEESLALPCSDTAPEMGSRELLACSSYHQGAFRQAVEHADAGIRLYDPAGHLTLMARYGENPGVACRTWAGLAHWYLGH